jgi:hypothetical protein
LQVCLCGCFICFTHMLQVFFLDVAYVFNCFSCVFTCVSDTCFECFNCFVRMLHLDVSKVDRRCCACCHVSHLPQPPAAAAGALYIEGNGTTDVEGVQKAGRRGLRLNVQQSLARVSRHGSRPHLSWPCTNPCCVTILTRTLLICLCICTAILDIDRYPP